MNKRIQTTQDIREFLEGVIQRNDSILAKMDGERAAGHLAEFMRYDAISLVLSVFHREEAMRFIAHLDKAQKSDGSEYTDIQKFTDIKAEVENYVIVRSQSMFSEDGRSSSISANLAKDAVKDFYMEFFRSFQYGY
ncbi:hypothetical protein D3C71_153420 [compost metagenome]